MTRLRRSRIRIRLAVSESDAHLWRLNWCAWGMCACIFSKTKRHIWSGAVLRPHIVRDPWRPLLANRAMLEQYASSDSWIGVGGTACFSNSQAQYSVSHDPRSQTVLLIPFPMCARPHSVRDSPGFVGAHLCILMSLFFVMPAIASVISNG